MEPVDPQAPAPTLSTWVRDTAERALSSFVEALAVMLPTLVGAWNVGVWKTILVATFPAVAAVILAAVTRTFPAVKSLPLDIVFRIVRTAVATVASAAAADGFDIFDVTAWRTAGLAGLMAAAVLIKSLVAARKANTLTPASFAVAA